MKRVLALALAAVATAISAQPLSSSEQAWNALARADAEAALKLIKDNHPGAAPELGDTQFQALLAAARGNVEKRLPLVKDYFGHAALMNGLANDFRDGHIMTNALVSPSRRTWAGLAIARAGGLWIVGAQEAADGEPVLKGARLISCDGADADRLAREHIGAFYAHPGIEADMASRAVSLLLDNANPFIKRPVTCKFRTADDRDIEHKLRWRSTSLRTVERVAAEAYQPGQATMGLSPFAGGYWIGMPTLSNESVQAVEAVRARQAELRAAPMVVLDLRGNSGGNSQYAVEIARVLMGDARVAAVERPPSDCNGMYWRVSKDNSVALRKFADELPADRAPEWTSQADALERAVSNGKVFSPDLPACARQAMPPAVQGRLPPPAMNGRLVLVTDRACFSSCLMATDLFRRLGATHVGEATDMSTRYMEVREIVLPSGLRTFSTLQKVALGAGDFGPYEPQVVYPGSLADTDKLKAWVAALPR